MKTKTLAAKLKAAKAEQKKLEAEWNANDRQEEKLHFARGKLENKLDALDEKIEDLEDKLRLAKLNVGKTITIVLTAKELATFRADHFIWNKIR